MADAVLQARISELPAATKLDDTDQFEVSQGSPPVSRRSSLGLIKSGVKPDLSPYLTGLVGGAGVVVAGGAPIPTVSLEHLDKAGHWGDAQNIPEVTVDAYGRVTGVVLVPVGQPDLTAFAPLDSPAFTGQPTAPLAPQGDSSAHLPTTQWVQREITASNPDLSRYAPLASPLFTGDPKAPTPPAADNDTSIPTTAWVNTKIAASGFLTDAPSDGKSYGRKNGGWSESSAAVAVGDTAPVSPTPNQLWWNSTLGVMFVFYNDGNSSQWVPAAPSAATATPPFPQPGILTLYSEQVCVGGETQMNVSIPANAKRVELEWMTRLASGSPSHLLQVVESGVPNASGNYSFQSLYGNGSTAGAGGVLSQTSWSISGGSFSVVSVKFTPVPGVYWFGILQQSLIQVSRYYQAFELDFPCNTALTTGFRVTIGSSAFAAGSYFRAYVVV